VSRCFVSLRGLRQIRGCVPPATLQMMVVTLVHSRLDYGNSVLVGLPVYLMRQLQSVLNAAARLIFRLKASDHITDALIAFNECCGLHSGSITSSLSWRTKCYMDVHQVTSGHLFASPMCLVVEYAAPPARIASWCRQSRPRSTIGSRAFSVAAPLIWNSLPDDVISAESLPTFQRKLKRKLTVAYVKIGRHSSDLLDCCSGVGSATEVF